MRTALILVATASVGWGHHSLAEEYDKAVVRDFKVTVGSVSWMNPHATFTASVTQADGSTALWTFEMCPPNTLLREGWAKDSLQANDVVTVTAYPAKDGSAKGSATRIVWADGHSKDCADSWMWSPRPAKQ